MAASVNKGSRMAIVYNSMYAIISGVALDSFAPMFGADVRPLTILIEGVGVLGIAYYGWTWSKYDKLFRNLGLGINGAYPLFKSKVKGDYSTVYKFTLPNGLCLKDFEDQKERIEQHFGREIDIKYTYKELTFEEFNQNIKTKYDYVPTKIQGNVPIMAGYNRHSELISCDLSVGEPHMGVYGESGSGKSTVLRAIITNLILQSDVKLHLVDLKNGAEFGLFRKSSKVINFCRNISETKKLLSEISVEVDRRYDIFYEKDVKDIKVYNSKFKNKKMDYQVLVIDEFADLHEHKDCMLMLKEIARKSRACGIHLIISTQHPLTTILDSDIKANITSILGLKTLNGKNSQVIIDEVGLEKLRGHGNGIFKRSGKVEIQAPLLEPDDAVELIKHTYINKVNKNVEVKNGNVSEDSAKEAIDNL